MFENFTAEKPKRTRMRLLAIASAIVHLTVGGLLVLMGLWEIQEVSRPHRGVAMASMLTSPAGGGSEASEAEPKRVRPKKRRVVENRQPNVQQQASDKKPSSASDGSEGDGTGQGPGTGEGPGTGMGPGPGGPGSGSSIVGKLCLDPDQCPTLSVPAQIAEEPRHLPPAMLSELERVAGNPQVTPPSSTQNDMARKDVHRTTAIVEMCLNKQGSVDRQRIVRSSGYQAYDAKLLSAVRRWRYRPYTANGMPVAICSHITFIYQQ